MNINDYLTKQLQNGEDALRIVRRHPVTIVPAVGLGGFLILLDFFFLAWWFRHGQWGVGGFVVFLIIGVVLVIRGLYVWRNNILVVTTQRVIDIDQHGFFERNVAEATYDKIQDVRYTVKGMWPTIFRFGSIVLQTAGNNTNLELEDVQRPVELQQLITDVQRQAKAKNPSDLSAAELLEVVDRLKTELGPEGVERLLRKQGKNSHAQEDV